MQYCWQLLGYVFLSITFSGVQDGYNGQQKQEVNLCRGMKSKNGWVFMQWIL